MEKEEKDLVLKAQKVLEKSPFTALELQKNVAYREVYILKDGKINQDDIWLDGGDYIVKNKHTLKLELRDGEIVGSKIYNDRYHKLGSGRASVMDKSIYISRYAMPVAELLMTLAKNRHGAYKKDNEAWAEVLSMSTKAIRNGISSLESGGALKIIDHNSDEYIVFNPRARWSGSEAEMRKQERFFKNLDECPMLTMNPDDKSNLDKKLRKKYQELTKLEQKRN
jgi:phage gpG-like protein